MFVKNIFHKSLSFVPCQTSLTGIFLQRNISCHQKNQLNRYRHHQKFLPRARNFAMASMAATAKKQPFDYYLVLDFEATCDLKEANKLIKPKEIIEFPVLKVNGSTFDVEDTFHTYVQPKEHPVLTSFCSELTGIVQEMVDGQPYFEKVMQDLNYWLIRQQLLSPDVKFAFVTCGDWDLKIMLPEQCNFYKMHIPNYFRQWINIKRTFAEHSMKFPRGLMDMLAQLNLEHQGRLHSGIDDCRNIAAVMTELARRGAVLQVNGQR